MATTSYDQIYARFLNKIHDYELLEDIQVEEGFTKEVLLDYLKSAVPHFTYTDVNFESLMDNDLELFNSELSTMEQEILARFMIVEYMSPKLLRTEIFEQKLGSKDFQTYSPGNLLAQLTELRNQEEVRTNTLMLQYYYMGGV